MRLKIHAWLAVFCAVLSLQAQTNLPTKPISLKECVQLALENNFDIAIDRYKPRIEAYALGADYGYYDPQLNVFARHTFEAAEGEFDPRTGIQSPAGSGREEDLLNADLAGRLPTGLRYGIGADYRHSTGTTERNIVTINEHNGPTRDIAGFVPFDQYSTALNISLEQPLLRDFWIDAGRLRIKLQRKDVRISEYQLLFTIQDTVRKVEQTYYSLIAAMDQVGAWQKSVDLAQGLLDEIRKRIDAGQMAPLDEKQAEAETARRRTRLVGYQRIVIQEENKLKNLISNQSQQWHGIRLAPAEKLLAVAQRYDIQESWMSALNSRPDFNRVKEEMERQGLVVKYDFNQLFPYLSLVGTYGRRGFDELVYRKDVQRDVVLSGPGGQPTTNDITTLVRARDASYTRALRDVGDETNPKYSYGMILNFPLSFRQDRYNFKGSKALEQQLTTVVQQKQQEIMIDIDDAISAVKLGLDRVQSARQWREYAEIAVDAERKKLDNARTSTFNVLGLQWDLSLAREAEIQALENYNTAVAELQFQEGRILEKQGIAVDVTNK